MSLPKNSKAQAQDPSSAQRSANQAEESSFGSPSVLGSLRELDLTAFGAAELVRPNKRSAIPAAWTRLVWWRKPGVLALLMLKQLWSYLQRLGTGVRWAMRLWLRRRPGLAAQSAEVLLWPAVFIYLCWASNPENMFYINQGFPWPWLAVWLIALRYGALAGAVAALELLAAWYLIESGPGIEFARVYFLGGGIVTLIAGEFGSFWGARAHRFREATHYMDDKIERLTRRLYLLKLSHDELELEMVDRPGTLRDALFELRTIMEAEHDKLPTNQLPGAKALMHFMAQYCQIEAGGIFRWNEGPKPSMTLLASIGTAEPPEMDDPMLRRAIETGQSIHLQDSLIDQSRKLSLLVVAPIRNELGDTVGVLAVNRLPFMALNPDNLRNIWVLLQSYGEYLRLSARSHELALLWPAAPLDLRHELAWLQRLQLDFGLQSWCVVWRAAHSKAPDILEQVRQLHASGEMAWVIKRGSSRALVSLMPFVGIEQVKLQAGRIQEALAHSFGPTIAQGAVFSVEVPLGHPTAWELVRQLVEEHE